MVDEAITRATPLPMVKKGTGMEGRPETIREIWAESGSFGRRQVDMRLTLIQGAFQLACPARLCAALISASDCANLIH
jgi:hypothetical protein